MAVQECSTKQGVYRGLAFDGYTCFRGIPYAKAPTGRRRFQAPEAPDTFEGVRDAVRFGPCAPQNLKLVGAFYEREFFNDPNYLTDFGEDCLRVNVWTPADSPEEKLPVVIWIHGGAFTHGTAFEKEFDGKAYAKEGIILVTIAYRLGVLGFLAHPWLTERSKVSVNGNYGILDQLAAIRWVQENIEAFGGDAQNMTLMGQSAGSISAQLLTQMPENKDMIRRAIFQSAAGYGNELLRLRSLKEAEAIGLAFTEFAGIRSPEELFAMSAKELIQKQTEFLLDSGTEEFPFFPCVDGTVIRQNIENAVEDNMQLDIPYLLGSTKDDIIPGLSESCLQFAQYRNRQSKHPVYLYRFDRDLPGDRAGAFHSSELWYVFGTVDRSWRPMEEKDTVLSREMTGCWAAFIKGTERDLRLDWPPYNNENKQIKVFS